MSVVLLSILFYACIRYGRYVGRREAMREAADRMYAEQAYAAYWQAKTPAQEREALARLKGAK